MAFRVRMRGRKVPLAAATASTPPLDTLGVSTRVRNPENLQWRRTSPSLPKEALDVASDAALIDRARAGDATGFAGLYARHHVALYRTALAMTRHQARAEELVQEAFLRAYRHLGHVVLAPGASLRPWLQRILIHLVYDDAARRVHATVPLDAKEERFAAPLQMPTEQRVEARELRRTIANAIQQLPDKHQLVVVLFYLHDLDVGEIAETLGVPPGTVKSRLFYGRARLRELLAAEDPTAPQRIGPLDAALAPIR